MPKGKLWPEHWRECEISIRALPEEKIAEPGLPRCSYEEIHGRAITCVQMLLDIFYRDLPGGKNGMSTRLEGKLGLINQGFITFDEIISSDWIDLA